ncbi:hypothetical protein [Streptococcus sp. Marseille-Q5986]|uniref:hypothetical protein n=1 Tax=Streptococcus sp. Marseille-Q5986 TaxID=2972782 RepID=UPI00226553EA|nr:hypothetical protein [Streptococcus sp. Marseille-Q5986]
MKRTIKLTLTLAVSTLVLVGMANTVQADETNARVSTHQTMRKNPFRLHFEKVVLEAYQAAAEMAKNNYDSYAQLDEEIRKAQEELTTGSRTLIEVASSTIFFAKKLDSKIFTVDDFVNRVKKDFSEYQSTK